MEVTEQSLGESGFGRIMSAIRLNDANEDRLSKMVFDNLIGKEDLKVRITAVLEALIPLLTDHAGPFATNCVIGSKWRQQNDVDEFTKDGIKILVHLIVSEDAITRFTTRQVRFIGIGVDKRCHDGTTTSMLLFCQLALIAIRKLDMDAFDPERYQWTQQLDRMISRCQQIIDDVRIMPQDILDLAVSLDVETTLDDVKKAIAYHMAMISSKGDHDLATKIATLVAAMPDIDYGIYKDITLAVETPERYTLKRQEHDLGMRATMGDPRTLNYKSKTQYKSDNVVVFASANQIIKGSMESMFLTGFISTKAQEVAFLNYFGNAQSWNQIHNGRSLMILSPVIGDAQLIEAINRFNDEHPENRIVFLPVQLVGRTAASWDKTIHYMAGVPVFEDVLRQDATLSLIGLNRPVSARQVGTELALYNLYEKDHEALHPFMRDPEAFPAYTDFRKETKELLDFCHTNSTNVALESNEVTALSDLYRSLTCQTIWDIQVGGSIHEQYANRTVYEDSIGAALSAIKEGVVLGGYGHLARGFLTDACFNAAKYGDDSVRDASSTEIMVEDFAKAFVDLVDLTMRVPDGESTQQKIIDNLWDKWSYLFASRKNFFPDAKMNDFVHGGHLSSAWKMRRFLSMSEDSSVLLQAWSGYHEQFKRFKDMLVMLANTSNIADMRVKPGEDYK